jgi:archaemetzincin
LPVAVPGDWLWEHHEDPQSVATFLLGEPNRPVPPRTTICLAALGELDTQLDDLHDYLGRFFGLPVEIMQPLAISLASLDERKHGGRRQLRTGAILDELETRLPAHAYCMLAVTREDLYPASGWNFVFGQARLHARVGVQSLLRYDPSFDGDTLALPGTALRRGLKIVSHEVGHMFGIAHCVHHLCVMNGINHTVELDRSPMHLCRVCLRKLQLVVGDLDLATRYERLRERYLALGLLDAAAWVQARLATREL